MLQVEFRSHSVERSVCLSACPIVTNVYCEKTADLIEVPFGVGDGVDGPKWMGLRSRAVYSIRRKSHFWGG